MKRLRLLKPLQWTIDHASYIWETKDLLPDVDKYPPEIKKETGLITTFLDKEIFTVKKYGWILYGIGDRAENLQKIFLSGTNDESHFDRSVHLKVHPKREGQKVICIEVRLKDSFVKKVKRQSDYLVFDTKGKLIPCSFGAMHCPNWDPDCPEALQYLKEGDIFLHGGIEL